MDAFLNLNWSWNKFRSRAEIDQFYDATFSDDEKDVFLCHINEIDHIHLLGENNIEPVKKHAFRDPRTGKEITQFLKNWSSTCKNEQLHKNFPRKSSMNVVDHKLCIRVLDKSKNTEITDENYQKFLRLAKRRELERKEFSAFVQNYCQTSLQHRFKQLDESLEAVVINRRKRSIEAITDLYIGEFSLRTAIPLENLNGHDICSVKFKETIKEHGAVPMYSPTQILSSNILQIKLFDTKPKDDYKCSNSSYNTANCVINLASIFQLMHSSSNFSENWNMPFTIKNNKTYIEKPLPKLTLSANDRFYKAYKICIKSLLQKSLKQNSVEQQIGSDVLVKNYCIIPFDEYLTTYYHNHPESKSSDATNNYVVYNLWNIGSETNSNQQFQMLVQSNYDCFDRESKNLLINLSIKLEFQSEFGAEQMTQHELLAEWCKLKFHVNSNTDRFRCDAITGKVLSHSRLTLQDVENEIMELYNLEPNRLLLNFLGVLKTVSSFPDGNYLFRHAPKNQKNVMIYGSCNESTANSITIRQIYEANPNSIANQTEFHWNPIDHRVVTAVHKRSHVMPCAFPPWPQRRELQNKNNDRKSLDQKIIPNDRDRLVQFATQKLSMKQKQIEMRQEKQKQRLKLLKQRKKNNKRSEAKAKKKLLSSQTESIDPYEVFDSYGNISINGLMANSVAATTISEPAKEQEYDNSDFDLTSYVRDASLSFVAVPEKEIIK